VTADLPYLFRFFLGVYFGTKAVTWFFRWLTTAFAITSQRLLIRSGFLSKETRAMTLLDVERIDVDEGILGSRLGWGTVVLFRKKKKKPLEFKSVADPLQFQRCLHELKSRALPPPIPGPTQPAADGETIGDGRIPAALEEELVRLADLHRKGLLTKGEYEALKRRVLGLP
jgi:hypothetical protein